MSLVTIALRIARTTRGAARARQGPDDQLGEQVEPLGPLAPEEADGDRQDHGGDHPDVERDPTRPALRLVRHGTDRPVVEVRHGFHHLGPADSRPERRPSPIGPSLIRDCHPPGKGGSTGQGVLRVRPDLATRSAQRASESTEVIQVIVPRGLAWSKVMSSRRPGRG